MRIRGSTMMRYINSHYITLHYKCNNLTMPMQHITALLLSSSWVKIKSLRMMFFSTLFTTLCTSKHLTVCFLVVNRWISYPFCKEKYVKGTCVYCSKVMVYFVWQREDWIKYEVQHEKKFNKTVQIVSNKTKHTTTTTTTILWPVSYTHLTLPTNREV